MSWLYENNARYVSLQLTIRYHEGCTALQGHTNISVGTNGELSEYPFDLKKVFPISINSLIQIYSNI